MDNITYVIGTTIGVAIVAALRDVRDGKSLFKRNGHYSLPHKMDKLIAHYNEETTQALRDIRDGVRDMNNRLDTLERNGIKCARR